MLKTAALAWAHRGWRILPHRLRRRALDRALLATAPRLADPRPDGQGGFVVAGVLSAPTGLGEAARLTAKALQACGEAVSLIDLTGALRQNRAVTAPDLPSAGAGPGTLLVFVQPPLSAMALKAIGPALLADRRRVAAWVWEREAAPPNWARHAGLFDDIVAPSRFAAAAIQAATGRAVGLVPYPAALSAVPAPTGPADRPFTVGFVGDVVAAADRKNPAGAVEAFRLSGLKAGTARLRLHLHGERPVEGDLAAALAAARAEGCDVEAAVGIRSPEAVLGGYGAFDLYLSLHRAEGFGLTLSEAMLAGVPVVATDWSSTQDFVDDRVGYPVPATLVPAPRTVDERVGLRWAEPDLPAAAAAIRRAFGDRAEARAKGLAGRERILRQYAPEAVVGALRQTLWGPGA